MNEEINSLIKNHTLGLVQRPKGRRVVRCKWVYKLKEGAASADPWKFKARSVARDFTQQEGINFHEVFPVVKHTSIRVLVALTVAYNLELEQMDVRTAFLHGELEEEMYMEQPEGFIDQKLTGGMCLLKKSLNGLKQSL